MQTILFRESNIHSIRLLLSITVIRINTESQSLLSKSDSVLAIESLPRRQYHLKISLWHDGIVSYHIFTRYISLL